MGVDTSYLRIVEMTEMRKSREFIQGWRGAERVRSGRMRIEPGN